MYFAIFAIMRKIRRKWANFDEISTRTKKKKNLLKFDGDIACIVHAVTHCIHYITLNFGRIKSRCVRIQIWLKQKFSFSHFRENFFTKIAENSGNINDVDYF
jgi:hypothetical protein